MTMESSQLSENDFMEWCFDLTPTGFEDFIADVYQELGWVSRVTGGSNDRGIDIKLARNEEDLDMIPDPDVLVQVKRKNSSKVGMDVIQRLAGEAIWQNPEAIMVVTTKGFTDSARRTKRLIEENVEFDVELLDYQDLYRLIDEKDIFHVMDSY